MNVKHFPTYISNKRVNEYIAECMGDFINVSTKDGNDIIDGLLFAGECEHWYLDQYIDIPRGIEGDHLIRRITDAIKEFIYSFPERYEAYLDVIIDSVKNNQRVEIHAGEHGIWIDIPSFMPNIMEMS